MDKEVVRVLILEDDPDIREAFSLLLEADGYTVQAYGDAESALAEAAGFQPAAVLVDFALPGMDGADFTAQLRRELGSELVVIAVTAASRPEDHERLEAAGIDFLLPKPLAAERLRRFLPPLNGRA